MVEKRIKKSKKPKTEPKRGAVAKKIMIVDDEKNVCTLVKSLLEREGYDARTALSGKEALTKLRAEKVDLVLIDFYMSEMDGKQLCEKIRADPGLKDLKLALLTVAEFGKEVGHAEMKTLRILDYIHKPFDNLDLIAKSKSKKKTSQKLNSKELCKKSIILANKDAAFLKKIKGITVSLNMKYKDKPGQDFCLKVSGGKFKTGKLVASPDFEITTKENDFYKVVSGKTPGLIAMAMGKMKITKGDMTELGKLIPTLSGLTDFAKKYLECEG